MYYELSNPEKKIVKVCPDKGRESAFREGMENFETIIPSIHNVINFSAVKYTLNLMAH